MTRHRSQVLSMLLAVTLAASGWAAPGLAKTKPVPPPPPPAMDMSPGPLSSPTPEPQEPVNNAVVRSTVMPGTAPVRPAIAPVKSAGRGDVSLNFPQAAVRDVAQAVLGDMLGLNYVIDDSVKGTMTLVTTHAVPRKDVLPLFEDALKAADLALVHRGAVYAISSLDNAKGEAPVLNPDAQGFGNETIQLKFVSAAELKKLLDPIIPNAISQIDEARNMLVITGTTTQRKSVHDLIGQFDVDWLKGMSFGLFIPQRTDSRLITPELEKLLNGPGAPTAGLVRLISMERLNGILAISSQPQYLDDVRHWVEVLDREGESAERKLFVYRVQNGRSSDLARTLVAGFGGTPNSGATGVGSNTTGVTPPGQPSPITGFQGSGSSGAGSGTTGTTSGFHTTGSTGTSGSTTGSGFGSGSSAMPGQSQAGPVSGSVNLQLGGPAGNVSISSDEANNAIVVFATPREYAVVEDALHKLDVLPLQVMIEAAITEVTLTDDLKYGVQFYLQSANSQFSNSNVKGRPRNFKPTLPGFNYLYSGFGGSIQAALDALSSLTQINVISAPKLMVLNNQTASLEVGDQVPISTGSAVSTVSGDAPIVNEIEYRDTGVILTVTPRVNSGGLVLLDISQEVSDVSSTSTSNIDSPTIQQRKFASSIAVQDGQTVALGGLIRDSNQTIHSGLPGLSKIPVVGGLFGSQETTHKRTELLVLLTPRVVRNPDDAKAITEELMRKIRTVAPLSTVKAKPK
jgi:general secretion pathway protein D